MSLILSKSQADAVYKAMTALSSVGASIGKIDLGDGKFVRSPAYETSDVGVAFGLREHEFYESPAAFAAAYAAAYALSADQAVPVEYNDIGHVCPETGRIAMTLAQAYEREDSPDRNFYVYSQSSADQGLDPWRAIDGLDASSMSGPDGKPDSYTIDYASGQSRKAQATLPVYMQRSKAERAA